MEDQNPPVQQPNPFAPQQTQPQTPPPMQDYNLNFWKYIGIGMSIVSFCLAIAFVGYLLSIK